MHVTVRVKIPSGQRKEVYAILGPMIERTKLEEGCLSCRLYKDVFARQWIMFEEIWVDEASLQRHLHSDEFRVVLIVVEMASQAPEIRLDTLANPGGLREIEAMRNGEAGSEDSRRLSPPKILGDNL
jgi:quinol monooxygenase YgiN